MPRIIIALAAFALAVAGSSASAVAFRLLAAPVPLSGNPADSMTTEIDPYEYDPATHCSRAPRPGMVAFARWLERSARGVSWGTYRCELWGRRSTSLHAEGRALDWHLDVGDAADRAEARRLITLLLAPDALGNEHALARRMGIEEVIWDCSYWRTGMEEFVAYAACVNRHGQRRHKVDRTVAHRNHIHFGMTRAGAAGRTSFWRARR